MCFGQKKKDNVNIRNLAKNVFGMYNMCLIK